MGSLCAFSIIIVLLTGQFPLINFVRADNYDDEIEFVDLEKNYQKQYAECCHIGKKQATNKGYCSGSNKINECKSLSELCCLEQLSLRECQSGVKFVTKARKNNRNEEIDCIRANSYRESFEYRCCSACQMGFMAADNRLGGRRKWCSGEWIQAAVQNLSSFSSLVTTHIETAYVQCCNHGMTLNADNLQSDSRRTDKIVGDLVVAANTSCKDGFEFSKKIGKCIDIDECATNQNDCHKTNLFCVNSPGSYSCSRCKAGFTFDEQLAVCRDVNECDQQPYPCKAGQSCRNLVGNFKCFCQLGYEMDKAGFCIDVNECQLGTHNCHESLRCDNTIGSFHCVRVQDCGTGYTINADQDICEDVNECQLGTHDCLAGYQCRNTQGSFKCELVQCPEGQQLVNASTGGACREMCPAGQRYNAALGVCLYIDACLSNPCKVSEQCITQKETGTYECSLLCPPGYHYNTTSKSCTDVDECTSGQFECGPNQVCVNLPGHYDCACRKGFQMDSSRTCVDINECTQEWWHCQHPYKCTNTIGSFNCSECHTGFIFNWSTRQCDDVDECANATYASTCQHICYNTPGSFRCHCRQGYKLAEDGKTCVDVDECELMKNMKYLSLPVNELDTVNVAKIRACKRACTNTIGSFECKCPSGFRSHRERCYDINECIENTRLCSSGNESICVNTFGGYECEVIQCPPGYNKTTTNKSVQCLFNEKLPADYETIHKIDYLFYAMYSNQTIKFSRSSIYTFYATRFISDELNNSYTSKYGAYFDLLLISSTPNISQHEYFRLTKPRLNEASISLLKPLAGPQNVKLELTIIGYKKFSYYRQKVFFIINVSEYESM